MQTEVKQLAEILGIGLPLAQDLYDLGDQDVNAIIRKSAECNGVAQLKSRLLVDRLADVDAALSDVWDAIDKIEERMDHDR